MRNAPAFDILRREPRQILIGHDVTTGAAASLSLADFHGSHLHALGSSGSGKTRWLVHVATELIRQRSQCAFGLIDPHASASEMVMVRLRKAGVPAHKIVLFDPSDRRYALSFDPLRSVADPGDAASFVVDALMRVSGAQSFDQSMRLEALLRAVTRALRDSGLSLLHAPDVLAVDNVELRRVLRERVTDRFVRLQLEAFDQASRTERLALSESSRNRWQRVLHAEPIQWMLGQKGTPIDFTAIMDGGKYFIANLSGLAPETQRVVGALLLGAIHHGAMRREGRQPRPWTCVVDEFGEFVSRNQTFSRSLDAVRKRSVGYCLLHQRLSHLEQEDPDLASAVMTNAKIKIAFSGLSRGDCERMALELFTGAITGDRVKHIATQVQYRPIDGEFTVETESGSESESDSESWSQSSGHSSGDTDGSSIGFTGVESETDPDALRYGEMHGHHESSSASESSGAGRGRTTSRSWSRSVVPVTRHDAVTVETGRQFYSLSEELERHVAILHSLPKREALIRVHNGPVMRVRTPEVANEERDARVKRFHITVMEACKNVTSVADVQLQIAERQEEVRALIEGGEVARPPFPAGSFRE